MLWAWNVVFVCNTESIFLCVSTSEAEPPLLHITTLTTAALVLEKKMGQTDTRTVTTPLLYAFWCERGRRKSEKLASTHFIAVYSRSGFWVMFQLLRVTLEESMRFESFDWLIFTRTNALYRPVSVCLSVCHKSNWNEPYSSSSFTKLSCSKVALYRWIKKRIVAEINSWFLCHRPTDQKACGGV